MFSGMSVLTLVLYAGLSWLLVSFQVHIKSLHIIIIIILFSQVQYTFQAGGMVAHLVGYQIHDQ